MWRQKHPTFDRYPKHPWGQDLAKNFSWRTIQTVRKWRFSVSFHGSLVMSPFFTSPSYYKVYGLLDGYYFWWCPIFPKWDSYQPLHSLSPFFRVEELQIKMLLRRKMCTFRFLRSIGDLISPPFRCFFVFIFSSYDVNIYCWYFKYIYHICTIIYCNKLSFSTISNRNGSQKISSSVGQRLRHPATTACISRLGLRDQWSIRYENW